MSTIGRDNPPDLAPEHLAPTELEREPEEGFVAEDAEIVGADIVGAEARSGRIVHARIEGLRAADAVLRDLRLIDVGTDFSRAEMAEVDLRGSDLSELGRDVAALRGAIVDSSQLIDLARPLAAAAGIKVENGI
jgi:uncharacterized protein YjbI with pentapeptide repeats